MKSRIKIVQGGSCFVAGTKVKLADHTYKNIEDITKGDNVLSLTSNIDIITSEVYDCWENQANKPIISFITDSGEIKCTYDHKFYTPTGYEELYKIVWGDLDTSQRLQLKLLCEQYGADIDNDPSWREIVGDHEAIYNSDKQQEEKLQSLQNSDGSQDSSGSQSNSTSVARKSKQLETGGSHKWRHSRQSCRKFGVGDERRKYSESIQNGIDETQKGGAKWKSDINRQTSGGNTQGMGRHAQIQKKRDSCNIWGIRKLHQGHIGAQVLSPFATKQIQIQEPEKTFAISVRNENYFVGDDDINVSNSAGKTIALLLILIDIAQSNKNKMISVVSETIPHLKRGAIRDFLNIMKAHRYYDDNRWNKTDYMYEFETGSKMEFFSADSQDKVRGPRRDILFINEANNIDYDTYTQLSIRTNETIYIDFNPVSEFWVHTELIPNIPNDFIIVTYQDNEALPASIVQELEQRKNNKYFWTVYGLGQIGEVEEKIYKDWLFIEEIPHEARLVRYGLDFGYTNDPTSLIAVYEYNRGYILDEIIYQKGMSNKQIADTIKNSQQALVIADSAEPKSIDEIRSYGINIIASEKGADSVKNGISFVQEQRISVTKRSLNLIKEYRNYFWIKDKNGKVINEPNEGFDHGLDAVRYAIVSLRNKQTEQANIVAMRNKMNMNKWRI